MTQPKQPVVFKFNTVHLIAFIMLLLSLGYMVGTASQRQSDAQEVHDAH